MIVIAKDTEVKLLEELRKCKAERPSQRCFYMAFSRTDISSEKLFASFLSLLQDLPNSYMAHVYICEDKDIFILMQGFMQRQFTDFMRSLANSLSADDLMKLADIMEVGVHWQKLETICQKKIDAIENRRSAAAREEEKEKIEKATLAILSTLDPAQILTVESRRQERGSPRVMIVDDDQISRTLVGNVIGSAYESVSAQNGREALEKYVDCAPDLLFLDIGLPDINGHDVLECVFQIDPAAYVVMFSGRKDQENVMRAARAGAQGFIGKPFTREKMMQYINRSPHLAAKNRREKVHANISN